jgi:uncharacterized protein (DUF4415 family)
MGLWEQMQRAEAKKAAVPAQKLETPPKPAPAKQPVPEKKPTAGEHLIKAAKEAQEIVKRGPKPSGKAKQLITLRLDPDVIEGFRAGGEGWQSRINQALREKLGI